MVYGFQRRHTVQLGNNIYHSESERYHYLLHLVQGYDYRMCFRNAYCGDGYIEQQSHSTCIDKWYGEQLSRFYSGVDIHCS